MPPDLGGMFMLRSYHPSECHADYFDVERIEALKPAIKAGSISFFFSSRRRHTRCSRDWSSDVCSSDLIAVERGFLVRIFAVSQVHKFRVVKVQVFGEGPACAGLGGPGACGELLERHGDGAVVSGG